VAAWVCSQIWFRKTRLYTSFPTKSVTILSVTPSVTHQKSVALSPKFPTLYTFVTNNNKIVLNDIIFKFKVIQPSEGKKAYSNTRAGSQISCLSGWPTGYNTSCANARHGKSSKLSIEETGIIWCMILLISSVMYTLDTLRISELLSLKLMSSSLPGIREQYLHSVCDCL